METHTPIQETVLRRRLPWSWVLVISCGLILGYYVLHTYASPKPRQYQLDFGRAQWIEPAERPAPIAYFRKDIYLSSLPEQAWIEVAASDTFGLIVNGRTVGTEGSVKTFEAGIYDIKPALKTGTNVIAVSVSRTSFPGPAQLLVRGEVREPGGNVISILSDESWRVTNHTGMVLGSEAWTSPQVQDQVWPNARRSPLNDQHVSIRWVDTNPLLLQSPSLGFWIMAPNGSSEAVFSTVIHADRSKQETWIQVASSGDLDLEVNGHIITVASTAVSGGKKLPHLTAAPTPTPSAQIGRSMQETSQPPKEKEPPFQPTELSAYDISYWIRSGPNRIVAAVRSEHLPASLFVEGFMVKSGRDVSRFSSNSHWMLGDGAGRAESAAQNVVEMGKNGIAPWGYLPQELARALDRSGFATVFESWLIVGLTLAVVIAVWLLVSALVSASRGEPLLQAMARDALLHGPVGAGLLLLLLPNYDPRFPVEWSFSSVTVVGAAAVLLLIRLLHLFGDVWTPGAAREGPEHLKSGARWKVRKERAREMISRDLRLPEFFEIPFRRLLPYLLLVLIMFLGLGLRYHNIGYMSFDHDEMGLVAKSKGIFSLGFPYILAAGEVRWITTYEAVPYPMALSAALFGYSEWSMRLPSLIMGTLSIGVIGLMGRRIFGWRTGLIAALIYACLPLNIRWAQNAFYPTQCQFMAMLTVWFFYESMQVKPFHRRYLTAATVTFCLTYLSWEGSAFLLPALFIALVLIRWRDWSWLRDFHLYRCLFFIGAVVIAQYCSRYLAGMPYLAVGSGLSNLSGPSLFFLAPGYQPMFYVEKLLLSENHVFFTLMILAGLPFCWKHTGYRYVVVILAVLVILHTNFLAALSPRYDYYYQSLLVLGGVATTVMLYDRVLALARAVGNSGVARLTAHATGVAMLVLLFVQSNESVLKVYELSILGDAPQMMSRLNTYRYDYRGAANYVMRHGKPGDVVLPGIPHVFNYYTNLSGDYFLDTLFSSKVPYNQTLDEPRYSDKFGGLPVIRNVTELKEVVNRSGRTWILFAPYASFEKFNSPAVLDYIHDNSKTVFESYRVKVYLLQGAQSQPAVAQAD
jgi:4-amino-4-deoxy-L-arabinose transferase-like glycosyltransferase